MNEETFLNEIIELIEARMGRYKKKITRETCIEKDLGISGDDAVEFLLDYAREFNVDITNFKIRRYFTPEGDTFLPLILRTFTGKKEYKEQELTIDDLERGVLAGRLDEEVINKKN